jgi:hypothetical protein
VRFLRPALSVVLLVAMVACGDGSGDEPTTTLTSVGEDSTTTSRVRPSTTAAPEPSLSDLTGNWDNGTMVLSVTDQGEYVIASSGEAGSGEVLMAGFVARDGDQFNFITATSGECPGQTGVYEATITASDLVLVVVDDPCQLRSTGFGQAFARGD